MRTPARRAGRAITRQEEMPNWFYLEIAFPPRGTDSLWASLPRRWESSCEATRPATSQRRLGMDTWPVSPWAPCQMLMVNSQTLMQRGISQKEFYFRETHLSRRVSPGMANSAGPSRVTGSRFLGAQPGGLQWCLQDVAAVSFPLSIYVCKD